MVLWLVSYNVSNSFLEEFILPSTTLMCMIHSVLFYYQPAIIFLRRLHQCKQPINGLYSLSIQGIIIQRGLRGHKIQQRYWFLYHVGNYHSGQRFKIFLSIFCKPYPSFCSNKWSMVFLYLFSWHVGPPGNIIPSPVFFKEIIINHIFVFANTWISVSE